MAAFGPLRASKFYTPGLRDPLTLELRHSVSLWSDMSLFLPTVCDTAVGYFMSKGGNNSRPLTKSKAFILLGVGMVRGTHRLVADQGAISPTSHFTGLCLSSVLQIQVIQAGPTSPPWEGGRTGALWLSAHTVPPGGSWVSGMLTPPKSRGQALCRRRLNSLGFHPPCPHPSLGLVWEGHRNQA